MISIDFDGKTLATIAARSADSSTRSHLYLRAGPTLGVAALTSLTKPLARRNILLSVWHGAHAMCPRRERYASARRRELCVTPHGASESATCLFTPFTSPIEKNTTSVVSAENASCLATAIITKREIDFEARSGFGVRRPLRFLAHKLDLNEKQITELARILDELKTERAQAEVDDRRALAEFSDAVAGEAFDSSKASSAGERRVQSAAKVRDTLMNALQQIHALLSPEQRQRLAYLIRTGVLAV